jgi:hypothetical protein
VVTRRDGDVCLAGASHDLAARGDDDRRVETQSVVGAVGGDSPLVERCVHVHAEVGRSRAGEADGRAGVEVLRDLGRCALRKGVRRVARQRQLGQEDDPGARLGRRADAVTERLDERRRVVAPGVLHEADPDGSVLGCVDAGEGLEDGFGLNEFHAAQYANTRGIGPEVLPRGPRTTHPGADRPGQSVPDAVWGARDHSPLPG